MVKFAKKTCVLILVIVVISSFGISCFAEVPEGMVSITPKLFGVAYSVGNGTQWSSNNYSFDSWVNKKYRVSSYPNPSNYSPYIARYYTAMCFNGENNSTLRFDSDYVYYVRFNLNLLSADENGLNNNPNDPFLPLTSHDDFENSIRLTNRLDFYNSSAFVVTVQDCSVFHQIVQNDEFYPDGNANNDTTAKYNHAMTDIVQCVFRLEDSYDQQFYWIGYYMSLSDADGQFAFYTNMTAIECYYDPTGEVQEDIEDQIGAGEIIQGQRDAVDYGLDREEQANQGALDDGLENEQGAQSAFALGNLTTALTNLYNSLTYTGTDGTFLFPASGEIPYLGELWDEQNIPFKQYIDALPNAVIVIARFVFWLGTAGIIIHTFYRVISYINGHKGDDE